MESLDKRSTRDVARAEPAAPPAGDWLRLGPYLLVLLSFWGLLFRYWGIQHDALAYMLQVVAKLRPIPLSEDIFLRFTSQEEFTLFPELCAGLVKGIGIDRTGSLLTFTFLVSWFTVAWFLMRRLQGARMAWLATGLLIVIPGWYSAGEVFRYAEPFLTARSVTEVVSLAALLACLKRRWLWAAAMLGLGVLLHPLMALPAILVAASLALPMTTSTRWGLLLACLVALPVIGSFALTVPQPFLDGEWLSMTRSRSRFLFAGDWDPRDREVFAATLLTLAIAARVLPQAAMKRVALGALCVGTAGLALAIIASEWLPLKLLLQGQSWRWLWLGRVIAIGVIPLLVATLWGQGRTARSAAVLLCSAWLLSDAGSTRDIEPIGVSGLLCALAWLTWELRHRISSRAGRAILKATICVLIVTGTYLLSMILGVAQHDFSFGEDPIWVQRAYELVRIPGLAALLVVAALVVHIASVANDRREHSGRGCHSSAHWRLVRDSRELDQGAFRRKTERAVRILAGPHTGRERGLLE